MQTTTSPSTGGLVLSDDAKVTGSNSSSAVHSNEDNALPGGAT